MTSVRTVQRSGPQPAQRPVTAPSTQRRGAGTWLGPLLAAVLSLVAAAQALQLWRWRPGTPLSLTGDAPQVLMQVRSLLEDGLYADTGRIGAPFGLNPAWYSTADALNFGLVRLLGLSGAGPATVSALFFLLQFPLAALTGYWLSRRLELTRPAAVVVGVLFSLLPGHQEWFGHLWLAAYWMVPLALWLVIEVARGSALWPTRTELRAGGAIGGRARRRALGTGAIVVAIGLSDVYYVAFTLILLGLAVALRLAMRTRPFALVGEVLTTAAIAVLCGGTLFIVTRGRAGDLVTGSLPAQRVIGESETYAGRIIDLLLPWHEHRWSPLRFLTESYGVATTPSVESPALGLVALVGALGVVLLAVRALATGRRMGRLTGLLAALTLVCVAFYTRGGLGSVVALFVTPQIRTWSRFVVFIGLLGLLAVGWWLSAHGRSRGRTFAWPAAAVVLLVGVLDQTNPAAAPDYASLAHQQEGLRTYGTALERAVGSCPVFQLPVVAFPEEPPPGRMGDYDHLLPSDASPRGLRWSYGAIRGTSRFDWQLALPVDRPTALAQDLADAGFCAVSVDRDGYAGATDPSASLESTLGAPVARDDEAGLVAFDLSSLRPDPARRDGVLRPVVASLRASLVDTSGPVPFQWTGPRAAIRVANLGATAQPVTVTFRVRGNGSAERRVTVAAPGVATRTFTVDRDHDASVVLEVEAAPGESIIEVRATGDAVPVDGSEGRRQAVLELSDLRVEADRVNAASLQQFAARSPRSLR